MHAQNRFEFRLGGEVRTVELSHDERGHARVVEVTEGDLTRFAFGCDRHTVELTFLDCEDYTLEDVRNDLIQRGCESYADDIAANCELWDVPCHMEAREEAFEAA